MERILQNAPFTASLLFSEDGTAVDPGTVTIGVTRDDGTVLVAAGTATGGATTAPRTFALTLAHTALLDRLTLTWTSATKGIRVSTLEVVGGFLFSIAQARTALSDAAYDVTKIAEARTYAETELESALNYAVVPRYEREAAITGSSYGLRLRPYLRTVRSASVAGVALSAADLTALVVAGEFVYGYSWPRPTLSITSPPSPVTIRYEHGLDTPPPGGSRAALAVAVEYLGGGQLGSIDPRAESIITDDGTIRLRTGDGSFTAPGVNAWVESNRLTVIA